MMGTLKAVCGQGGNSEMGSYADGDLVIRAQASDAAAFSEMVRRTSASSLGLAMSILQDRYEAEDQVQNSYIKAWQHIGQFRGTSKFSTWISRIVVNQCLVRLRGVRDKRHVYLDDFRAGEAVLQPWLADVKKTPEVELQTDQLTGLMRNEIRKLPPILRHVLVLRDLNEFSIGEVADHLGITVSAVKSRHLRARIELRKRLERNRAIS